MGNVSATQAFSKAKVGLMGTLYLCQKKAHYPAVLTVIGIVIKWLQVGTVKQQVEIVHAASNNPNMRAPYYVASYISFLMTCCLRAARDLSR